MRRAYCIRVLILICSIVPFLPASASDPKLAAQIAELQRQMRAMEDRHAKEMSAMRSQLGALQPAPGRSSLSKSVLEEDLPHDDHDHSHASTPVRLLESPDGRSHLDLGVTGTFAVGTSTGDPAKLELGGHDPHQRGFNVQSVELGLSGTLDPYFRAQTTILFGMENNSDVFVEIEEAWMETTSLPWDLSIRAGQYLTQFGVLNPTHLHDWEFVDTPLVNARLLGPDGLRAPGGQISWHLPLPVHSDIYFSIQNAVGEHDHSHDGEEEHEEHAHGDESAAQFEEMLYSARWVSSIKPSPSQILQGGASIAYGPNEYDRNTTVIGGDLTWLWQPGGGSRYLKWQTEAMVRRTEARIESHPGRHHEHEHEEHEHEEHEHEEGHSTHLRNKTFTDWGIYSQVVYGFAENWTAGFRGEYSEGFDRFDEPTRWRLSPALTFRPSENSKLRLQYNYDNIPSESQSDHTVWMQFEFSLGTGGAHHGHVH